MTVGKISTGAVVRDPFGREGIVCDKEPAPPEDWINEQAKAEEIRNLGPVNWWGVMPFGGGYLLFPEPMLEWLRPASYEDFLAAADGANVPARESLAKMFPEYLNRLLSERRSRGASSG